MITAAWGLAAVWLNALQLRPSEAARPGESEHDNDPMRRAPKFDRPTSSASFGSQSHSPVHIR
jgi:hypothetical protein